MATQSQLNTSSNSNQAEPNRIKVILRVRPPFKREEEWFKNNEYAPILRDVLTTPSPDTRVIVDKTNKSYTFDKIFRGESTQKQIFKEAAVPTLLNVFEGYCGAVLAYGQTGTGKTHTMQGYAPQLGIEEKGIIPRCADYIFDVVEKKAKEIKFTIKLNFVQIYLDRLQDLFQPEAPEVMINPETERVELPGITEHEVTSPEQFMKYYYWGEKHRVTRATLMNPTSSRGHAALIVHVIMAPANDPEGLLATKVGKLVLVDLAGYERFAQTGVTTGILAEEAKKINASLLALGSVVNALADSCAVKNPTRAFHIPYRNAKLTRLIRDCLGGTSKSTIILTIGPCDKYSQETAGTLYFGWRAMAVKVDAQIKQIYDPSKYIQNLKDKLAASNERLRTIVKFFSRSDPSGYKKYTKQFGEPNVPDDAAEDDEVFNAICQLGSFSLGPRTPEVSRQLLDPNTATTTSAGAVGGAATSTPTPTAMPGIPWYSPSSYSDVGSIVSVPGMSEEGSDVPHGGMNRPSLGGLAPGGANVPPGGIPSATAVYHAMSTVAAAAAAATQGFDSMPAAERDKIYEDPFYLVDVQAPEAVQVVQKDWNAELMSLKDQADREYQALKLRHIQDLEEARAAGVNDDVIRRLRAEHEDEIEMMKEQYKGLKEEIIRLKKKEEAAALLTCAKIANEQAFSSTSSTASPEPGSSRRDSKSSTKSCEATPMKQQDDQRISEIVDHLKETCDSKDDVLVRMFDLICYYEAQLKDHDINIGEIMTAQVEDVYRAAKQELLSARTAEKNLRKQLDEKNAELERVRRTSLSQPQPAPQSLRPASPNSSTLSTTTLAIPPMPPGPSVGSFYPSAAAPPIKPSSVSGGPPQAKPAQPTAAGAPPAGPGGFPIRSPTYRPNPNAPPSFQFPPQPMMDSSKMNHPSPGGPSVLHRPSPTLPPQQQAQPPPQQRFPPNQPMPPVASASAQSKGSVLYR